MLYNRRKRKEINIMFKAAMAGLITIVTSAVAVAVVMIQAVI